MISKLVKTLLTLNSIVPVFLIMWFTQFSKNWNYQDGLGWLILAISFISFTYIIFNFVTKKLEHIPIKILSISPTNKEFLFFLFLYLLPLINSNIKIIIFVLILSAFIIFSFRIYVFNPILALFGYRLYKITTINNVSHILITKRQINNLTYIKTVSIIDDNILIDKTD